MIYVVTNKLTGAEVYRYDSVEPVEWAGMEFDKYSHAPAPAPTPPEFSAPQEPRFVSKVVYLRRFTPEERTGIRAVAKADPFLEDYLEMMALADEIDLNDPDVVDAVNKLEAAGLIAAGRAQEILYGN